MRKISVIIFMMLFAGFSFYSCKSKQKPVEPKASENVNATTDQQQLVKQGEYLVTIMGCSDCHSPKNVGPQGFTIIKETMLSGYPANKPVFKVDVELIKKGQIMANEDFTGFAGPWGMSFAANITSDQTGIGNWQEENFRRAVKEGKYKGIENSRMLLPPMPWQNMTVLKDDDLKAIFSFLKSTNPVNNIVPAPIAPADLK